MLTDPIKGRMSYSKTIARANYGDLFAGATVRGATGSVLIDPSTQASADAQNPALVPLESDNLDFSVEYYFSDQGYVSAGFWEKRVDNFIGTTVLQQSLFDITDPTSGPDAQSALAFLQSAACKTQVTAAGEDVNAACSANDTALFTALAMLRHGPETGGLAAYDGSSAQILDMENRFDIAGEDDDPLYTFAVRRPVNQEKAKIHGWELGGQYFFGDTGFGLQANYTIVNGDVGFDNNAPPGTTQFALLGLSDTANVVCNVREVRHHSAPGLELARRVPVGDESERVQHESVLCRGVRPDRPERRVSVQRQPVVPGGSGQPDG